MRRTRDEFAVFKLFRHNAQRERLRFGFGFNRRLPISQYAGQLRDLSEPAAIYFLL